MNIIVTTPKSAMATAAREAETCIEDGRGLYLRRLTRRPKNLNIGDKVFYVEDGYIRGFAIVQIMKNWRAVCETTGKDWSSGFYVYMDATTWQWIRPIPMKGFRGWRYFDGDYEVVGNWVNARPVMGI